MKMAKIGLPKGSGKQLKVSEKSGNFEMDIEWQPFLTDRDANIDKFCTPLDKDITELSKDVKEVKQEAQVCKLY